ncbi:MAG TPA: transporter associated domain-containing protein, partial [Mariniphaga sp.]|nr:transporter associated domain-containing protein [Mariniphaga sp.]
KITESELRQMMKIASSQGVIEQEQNAIHEKVFFFSDKQARHLMTHRNEVEWIDVTLPEVEIKKFIQNAVHSKIVCSKKALDNYVGILYLHEYLKKIVGGADYEITSIMQNPYVVNGNTSAQKILELFRKEKIYLCIVVNQEEKIEGIITLHDILEHIVGTVPNEGEEYEPEILIHENDTILVNGEAPVEILTELIEGFEIDFEQVDYSSVAGYVYFQLNKDPEVGDKVEMPDYIIEVESIVDNKIDNVLIKKKNID